MISSTSNQQVKNVIALTRKAKARREQMLFVVEGAKMFEELPRERIERAYVSESFLKQDQAPSVLAGYGSYEKVTDEVFAAMSDTQTPQGIMALVRQYQYSVEDLLKPSKLFLMALETIQDPGNLGTIIRAAEGAGVTGIIMSGDTADIYNPKVIRSTMGSVYRMPFVYVDDFCGTLTVLKERKVRLFAAHLKGRNNYDAEDYTDSIGFLIGNESVGLSEKATALADGLVRIPMQGRVESLNAAVASSILMFEAARQRRQS